MSKQGMFRRVVDAGRRAFGLPVTHHYPDPPLTKMPHTSSTRDRYRKYEQPKRKVPACEPGSIHYHDKLVKHFGARKAEGYRQCYQRGFLNLLPTEQDFIDNPPWKFLK